MFAYFECITHKMSEKKDLEVVNKLHDHQTTLHERINSKRVIIVLENASLETVKVYFTFASRYAVEKM